jgi:hypothetical protein
MRVKVRDLRVGDGVDLETFPPDYPFSEATRHVAEFQQAEVIGENDGSPFTIESDTCWVLHTTEGSFGIDPDWEVEATGL